MYRILALSQDKDLYAGVRDFLESSKDIEIKTFVNNLDFLEKYASVHTDMVILDIDLLNEQVLKLINILQSIKRNSQILLILSKDKMSICSAAFSRGVISYLIKPVSTRNVYDMISTHLRMKSQQI
jgi:DNA-binding NtrC family response regulator